MTSSKYILAIDQGTSSTKTLIFDAAGKVIAKGTTPLQTNYFEDGFVEQDPQGIYENVLASVSACLTDFTAQGLDKKEIVSIGISNQRETFVVWDATGKPLHNAVVWQCKRSVQICADLEARGLAQEVNEKTGLIIDPYFSATKLIWLKENNPAIAAAIQNGSAYFGTIDTWLLYQLTNGTCYATDYTNASRTLLFNLHSLQWDAALIAQFGLSNIQLPTIQASSSYFGATTLQGLLPNATPIHAMIGDSHAAAFGEGCFTPGTAKATLGTGCSILMNVGDAPAQSNNGMISTICWSTENKIQYALEGVIVSCGSTIEWIKNELGFFSDTSETSTMATSVADNGGVYVIPSFSGLGSPHWQMERKASINGLHFGANKNHIVRAALESIPYQIKDVLIAMEQDAQVALTHLNVDGGITNNAFVMSFLAGLLQKQIAMVQLADVSALGAGLLAGLKAGIFNSLESIAELDLGKKLIPASTENKYEADYKQWTRYIKS